MTQATGGSPIWYELMTPDPAGAASFYGAVVGWQIPETGFDMPNGSNYRMIGRPDGGNAGGVLHLTQAMSDHGAKPLWIAYLQVANVAAAIDQVLGAGGSLLMPERELPSGRMAMVADPFGVPFYLMDPVPPPGQPDAVSDVFSPHEPHRCAWNELASPDAEAALAFYTGLLGWESTGAMDMGPMGQYHFVSHQGLPIGGIYRSADGSAPPWRCYFRVPDIHASAAAIPAHGGTITKPLHEVPGGDWTLVATDPQGAEFALVGMRDA